LLVLYGLHPDGLDVRLQKAIERARKAVAPHGANVELLAIREGEIHVRLSGKNGGCESTTRKLQELVENAIGEAAPEITNVQIENAIQSGSAESLVELQVNVSALQRA
jgi:Fe-S cluster biogenesis protein NfuA